MSGNDNFFKESIMENIVKSDGDRFADVVENVKLNNSLSHVLIYVRNIVANDFNDLQAQECLKVLNSMYTNTADAIGSAIE